MSVIKFIVPVILGISLLGCETIAQLPNAPVSQSSTPALPAPQTEQPLTQADADALMAAWVEAINRGETSVILPYLLETKRSPEFADAAIADYQSYFQNEPISRFELENLEDLGEFVNQPSQKFHYRLYSASGISKTVTLNQERGAIQMVDEFFQYSYPARRLLDGVITSVQSNDATTLAKVLTADDIDYPVTQAEDAIANYRASFDAETLQYRLKGIDANGFFVYTLFGTKAENPVEHEVTVIYGDGLVGIRDNLIPLSTN